MGFFQDLFGQTAAQGAKDAAAQKVAGLQAAQNAFDPYAQTARTDLTSGYGGAINTYTPGYNTGVAGASAYADITGANGPEGQARAQALFQTDPGYQFAVNQALQATQRSQGTGGFQDSGNVLTALQDRASGLAQQQYGNYVQRLAPFLGYSLGTAQQLGGAQTGQGTALGGLDVLQGQTAYGTQAGIGSAQAAGTLGAAQARTAASQNIFNQGVSLAGKLLGYANIPGLSGGGTTGIGNVSDYPSNIDQMIMAS